MALRAGRNASIYINGVDISGDANTINVTSEQDLAEISTFGTVGHIMYPGLSKDSGTLDILYNDAATSAFTQFTNLVQQSPGYAVMVAFGQSLGDPVYANNEVMLKTNSLKSVVTDVNRANISIDVDNYPFERGYFLSTGKQAVGNASTGTGTAISQTSPLGTTGGAAYLQVFDVSAGTLTVKVVTSSTGAFAGEQATTATFSAVSGATTARQAITTAIYQYAKASWVASAGTADFALSLVRYPD